MYGPNGTPTAYTFQPLAQVATDAETVRPMTDQEMALGDDPNLPVWLGAEDSWWKPTDRVAYNRLDETKSWVEVNTALAGPDLVDGVDGRRPLVNAATVVTNALRPPVDDADAQVYPFWSNAAKWTLAFVAARPANSGLMFGVKRTVDSAASRYGVQSVSGQLRFVDAANASIMGTPAGAQPVGPSLCMLTHDPAGGGATKWFVNNVQSGATYTGALPAPGGTGLSIYGGVNQSGGVVNAVTSFPLYDLWLIPGFDLSSADAASVALRAKIVAHVKSSMPSVALP